MKTIKRVGRLQPRDSIQFYRTHPNLFKRLKNYEEIEVPDHEVSNLTGIKILKDKPSEVKKSRIKKESFESKLEIGSDKYSE